MQFLKKFERGGQLLLEMKMRDGKIVNMPIDKLCAEDQKWIRSLPDPQAALVDLFSSPAAPPPSSFAPASSFAPSSFSAPSAASSFSTPSAYPPLAGGRPNSSLAPWPFGPSDLMALETGQTLPQVGERVAALYGILSKVPGPEEAGEWKERFTEHNFAVCSVLARLLARFELNPGLVLLQPPDPPCPSTKLIELLFRAMYVVPKPMARALVVQGAMGVLSGIICQPTPPRAASTQTICRLLETIARCCGRKQLAVLPRSDEISYQLFELFGRTSAAESRMSIVTVLVLLNAAEGKERLVQLALRSPSKDKLASMICLAVQKRGTASSVLRALWAFISQMLDPKKPQGADFFSRDILDKFTVSLLGQIQDYMEVPKLLVPALQCLLAVVSRSLPPDSSVLSKIVDRVSKKYGASNPAIAQAVRGIQGVVR